MISRPGRTVFAVIAPGILVAATGVGAGDLATAAFTGHALGVAILWAVLLGALLKFVLNEGLARWQLATGQTLLEGGVRHLGLPFQVFFLTYLVFWTFFVGAALMSACGVAAHAIWPVFGTPERGKIIFGVLHSLVGAGLVLYGGYRLFERVMSLCIALMFATVLVTAIVLIEDWTLALAGVLVPRIPDAGGQGLGWTVALIGGVGGTVTVMSYGYWIREEGRQGPEALRTCQIDLATGYVMTALFGMAMVVIGSTVAIEGQGAGLIITIADRLTGPMGTTGRWAFLLGAWGAVFSSLLGVWQSVPYLFADFWRLRQGAPDEGARALRRSAPYLGYLFALALIPIAGLFGGFQQIQKLYAIVGAFFMPILALMLLLLNGPARLVGPSMRNPLAVNVLLVATLVFFAWASFVG